MGCTSCKTKECRTSARDCFDVQEISLSVYGSPEMKETALAASRLIDNGRAGTLDRLEEIMEYCKDRGYKKIGVAYCFGMPDLARSLELELRQNGFQAVMVQCTAGGVKEKEIDETKVKETVSCNPAGQAHVLMNKKVDFVIEMGLCMGHDVIFHQTLKLPFTTFLVKDRVHQHNPAMALDRYVPRDASFMETMDDSFRMKSPDWVANQWSLEDDLLVIDVRKEEDYEASHIEGAINLPIQKIPEMEKIIEEKKSHTLVFYCTGGVQAAYAVMYFFSRGYGNVYLLSGGISRWSKEDRPLVTRSTSGVGGE